MINRLRVQGFKSWKDTGDLRIAPITGFFQVSILHLYLTGYRADGTMALVLRRTDQTVAKRFLNQCL